MTGPTLNLSTFRGAGLRIRIRCRNADGTDIDDLDDWVFSQKVWNSSGTLVLTLDNGGNGGVTIDGSDAWIQFTGTQTDAFTLNGDYRHAMLITATDREPAYAYAGVVVVDDFPHGSATGEPDVTLYLDGPITIDLTTTLPGSPGSGGGGGGAWGDITGTLSDQDDLQAALDAKLGTSGNAATATLAATIAVADGAADTTTWPMLARNQTGNQAATTDGGLTYDASTNTLTASVFAGSVAAANLTGAALPAGITSAPGLLSAAGGVFGTAAFTAATAYFPSAGGTIGSGGNSVTIANTGIQVLGGGHTVTLTSDGVYIDGVEYLRTSGGTVSGSISASGGITDLPSPTLASDAAPKSYVDSLIAGLKVKASVKAATTANGTLATAFADGQTIDGVALVTGDRILIKDQSTASQNGIYTVNASGAPTRATDADSGTELVSAFVFAEQGTVNADKGFVCTNNSITIGSTSIVFVTFTSAVGALLAANNLTDLTDAAAARVALGLVIGTNVQAYNATLAAVAAGTYTGVNTIVTLGTVGTGVWNGTAIGTQYGGLGANNAASSGVPLFASGVVTITGTTGTGTFVRSTAPTIAGCSFNSGTVVFTMDEGVATTTWDNTTGKWTFGGGGIGNNCIINGSTLTLGSAGTTAGSIVLPNATSGTITLQPATGALGTVTLTLPASTGTLLSSGTAVTVGQGGTGLTSGTSGGIPYFSATSTITSSAALTANALVLGGGAGAAPKVAAGLTTDGTSALTLGVAGTSVGSIGFKNATSGTITLQPTTGALGTITLTMPATTGTLYVTGGTDVAVADGGTGLSSWTAGQPVYASGTTTLGGFAPVTYATTGVNVTVANSATGVVPFRIEALNATSVDLFQIRLNTALRFAFSKNGEFSIVDSSGSTNLGYIVGDSGNGGLGVRPGTDNYPGFTVCYTTTPNNNMLQLARTLGGNNYLVFDKRGRPVFGNTTPTVAAGAGAGTTPTVTIVSGSNDAAGTVSVVTGTSPTASAVVATITFSTAYAAQPKVVHITPANEAARALTGGAAVWAVTTSTTTWTLNVGVTGLTASTTYLWQYTIIG